MVVHRFLFTLLCLLWSAYAYTAPQLILELDKNEVQLGDAINAELYGIGLSKKISSIDFGALNNNFSLSVEETTEVSDDPRWPKQSVQTMSLKLYPRKTGKLPISPLTFADANSLPDHIVATKPGIKSRAGIIGIDRSLTLSSSQPWQRQQTMIDVKLSIADTFVSLNVDDLKVAGFEVFKLPEESEVIDGTNGKYTILHARWALFPLLSGEHTIDLPGIQLRKSGRILGTYYFPLQKIDAKALPPYIPPTMPVGEITIHSTLTEKLFIFPGNLNFWDITLTGNGVSPNWMPPLLRQIQSNRHFDFLPVQAQQKLSNGQAGLQSDVSYHIPFKAKVSGYWHFPELRIQYFEPHSGKIIVRQFQPQGILTLGLFSRSILGIAFFFLLFLVTTYLYRKISAFIAHAQLVRLAFMQLQQAHSAKEIRIALHTLSLAEGWSQNMTLQDWARHWQSRFPVKADFTMLIDQLSRACYGNKPEFEINTFRTKLLTQLK